jgi:preprotein translocase subunit YajC
MGTVSQSFHPFSAIDLPLGLTSSPDGGGGNPIMGLFPLLMVLVIFYLLILRPQQRRAKQHQQLLTELKRGDRVLTNGGLFATIIDVKDEFFVATIAEGVKVEISRSAVAGRAEKKSK